MSARLRLYTRRVLIMVGLLAWLFGGPAATAAGGCVAMGASCHGPCLLTSFDLPMVPAPVVLETLELLYQEASRSLPTPTLQVPTPPPRPVLCS